MIILVDQDDVLGDFHARFIELWRKRYPGVPYVPKEKLTHRSIVENYPKELSDNVTGLYTSSGFITGMPVMPGAKEALRKMQKRGITYFICTSPLTEYNPNVLEKYQWTEEHFGKDVTLRMIVTKDKTLVDGDYLIDDNPDIKGVRVPRWEHVLYDQPYNRHVKFQKRLTWDNWESVLQI